MSRPTAAAVLALTIVNAAVFAPARAAPPTVVPSPGYDARLQQERATSGAGQPVAPGNPNPPVLRRHHARRIHTH
jgi:hypothetical protein